MDVAVVVYTTGSISDVLAIPIAEASPTQKKHIVCQPGERGTIIHGGTRRGDNMATLPDTRHGEWRRKFFAHPHHHTHMRGQ